MSWEVEIKAHASLALKDVIERVCGKEGEKVVKSDTYYAFEGDTAPRFRIRRENDYLVITAKENHREDGKECNKELEFVHKDTKDLGTMEAIAELLGYKVFIHKYKTGWSWTFEGVHIELFDVKYLGWYVELEIVTDTEGFETNKAKYDHLYDLIHRFGLKDEDVENLSYQYMLQRAQREIEQK